MNSTVEEISPLDRVPQAPDDLMFGLSAAYRADTSPYKVDLGVGAYRDDAAKPFILPAVQKAKQAICNDAEGNHEYLPIAGLLEYVQGSQRLVFGQDSPVIKENRVATVQTISGTGALHLGALFLSRFYPDSNAKRVWTTTPAYANHLPILRHVNLPTAQFPYYSPETKGLDFDSMLAAIEEIPDSSILLLHACAHNPTGVDPTRSQWRTLATVARRKRLLPFFDSAYQGFASGDVDGDAWSIRHFVSMGFDTVLVAQSYAKNMGLYGERVGCLHVVARTSSLSERILSQLKKLQRVDISTPPAYGARIAGRILNDPALHHIWMADLKTMAGRIIEMRRRLKERLHEIGTPGSWDHITDQVGMFCFSGLDEQQVKDLRGRFHIYTTPDGRFSMSGLNSRNVDYVARAIKAVVSEQAKL